MNSYTILRNNKEHGPYTLDELASQSLLSTDLIWVEGISAAWRTPVEINELIPLVKHPRANKNVSTVAVKPTIDEKASKEKTHKSQPSIFVSKPVKPVETERHFSVPSVESSATFFEENKLLKERKKQSALSYNFLGLGLLLIGAVMGAFVMKQVIGSFGNGPAIPMAKAKEIESQNIPISTATHTAEASFISANVETTRSLQAKKDAVVATVKPNQKLPVAVTSSKIDENSKAASDQEPQITTTVAQNNPLNGEVKISKAGENVDEITKHTSFKNSVELSANDYKIGLFGGVSDLQISVTNSTPHNIENLLLEVEFLKPNGTVAKTEIVNVSNVAVGMSKSVSVPSSNRGVKVRYRVVNTSTPKETIATDNM